MKRTKKPTVSFTTPIPYIPITTNKGVDSKDLVMVSLKQLLEMQVKIEGLKNEKN